MRVVLTSVVRPSRLYRGYIFDLDGTTYLDDALLPGVAATIRALRQAQCQVIDPLDMLPAMCQVIIASEMSLHVFRDGCK